MASKLIVWLTTCSSSATAKQLGWLLTEQRMAFRGFRSEVRALRTGDQLFLNTTRGCFGTSGRDRGRIVAQGEVRSRAVALDNPVEFAKRTFPVGCDIQFTEAAARQEGPEIAPFVPEMDLFRGTEKRWSIRLRRPLAPLTPRDAEILSKALSKSPRHPLREVLGDYARWWQR